MSAEQAPTAGAESPEPRASLNVLADAFNNLSPEDLRFLGAWVCMALMGLSEAEMVIVFRYANPELLGSLPGGPMGDRVLLAFLQLKGNETEALASAEDLRQLPAVHRRLTSKDQTAKDRRTLAAAFTEAFRPMPGRVLAALLVSLMRLRSRIARDAGLRHARTRSKEVGAPGGSVRIAALPCTPHAP